MADTDKLNALLAQPNTHEAVVRYADGSERIIPTKSLNAAEKVADREREKIGRDLLDRETGETVQVVSVTVREVAA